VRIEGDEEEGGERAEEEGDKEPLEAAAVLGLSEAGVEEGEGAPADAIGSGGGGGHLGADDEQEHTIHHFLAVPVVYAPFCRRVREGRPLAARLAVCCAPW